MAAFIVWLKPSKCSFEMQSIDFLGQIFDENGGRLRNSRVQEARDAYFRAKDLLVNASQLVIMNETDSLILYKNAI